MIRLFPYTTLFRSVFNVEKHAEIPAELGAILMCDARKLLGAQCTLSQRFRQIPFSSCYCGFEAFPAFGILLKIDAESALLGGAEELNVHDIEPMRGCNPLRRAPNFVQLDRHCFQITA